jgi:hypothetical protein
MVPSDYTDMGCELVRVPWQRRMVASAQDQPPQDDVRAARHLKSVVTTDRDGSETAADTNEE